MQSVEPFMLPPPRPLPSSLPTPSHSLFATIGKDQFLFPGGSLTATDLPSRVKPQLQRSPKEELSPPYQQPPHTHPDFFLKGYFSMGRITSFKGHLLPPSGPRVMMMALRHVPSLPRRKSCSYLARWSDSRSAAINTRESLISSARQQGRQTSCVKGQRGHQETSPQGKSPVH